MTSASHRPPKILGVDASPHGPGRTNQAIAAFLQGVMAAGAVATLLRHDEASVQEQISDCDGFVLGSPAYRGSPTAALRLLLENVPREPDKGGPLKGKVAAVILTGSAPEHFFATREASEVLRGFFACQVLSPDFHLSGKYFDDGNLNAAGNDLMHTGGMALAELSEFVRSARHIQELRPLA